MDDVDEKVLAASTRVFVQWKTKPNNANKGKGSCFSFVYANAAEGIMHIIKI